MGMNLGRMSGLAGGLMFAAASVSANDAWHEDLAPIADADWSTERAAHLLERAGFGGSPEDIAALAAMTPEDAVRHIVNYEGIDNGHLAPFDHSDIHDPGLINFPPSRPATTKLAKETGEALGVKVKPSGNRPMQPVVNKFFYWLRASMLETRRVSYWWADRMLNTNRPLEEKMTLFWHGHFANSESKVRDYRKMLLQNETFRRNATGNFRTLMVAVAQDPAMLYFLDAAVNVKGAPNENFAREIMELFTMGVGNYSERDIREAARAFTGWNSDDLTFIVTAEQHDETEKEFFGRRGAFNGTQVIEIILEQPVTADYLATKLYRYFVREPVSAEFSNVLGGVCATPTTNSSRCCGRSSYRAISTARPRSARTSRARSSCWSRPTRSSARRRSPAFPISTRPRRRWARRCSGRRPWPAGQEGAVGSLRACCSSGAISAAM